MAREFNFFLDPECMSQFNRIENPNVVQVFFLYLCARTIIGVGGRGVTIFTNPTLVPNSHQLIHNPTVVLTHVSWPADLFHGIILEVCLYLW